MAFSRSPHKMVDNAKNSTPIAIMSSNQEILTYSGFVSILGRPNVGKSSFLNTILDFPLVAVSRKPHTTRKKFLGIITEKQHQIIFLDTPGFHKANHKMGQMMNKAVKHSLHDSDLILCFVDASRKFGKEDQMVCSLLKEVDKPYFLILNKIDLCSKEQIQEIKNLYLKSIPSPKKIIHTSCKKNQGIDKLTNSIKKELPQSPFFYPKDQITDIYTREIAQEIIREKATKLLEKEVPHSIAVKIDSWQEKQKQLTIKATIFLERQGQKAILIGEQGKIINKIIKYAREDINKIVKKFVHLKTIIKIKKNWQNNKSFLKEINL